MGRFEFALACAVATLTASLVGCKDEPAAAPLPTLPTIERPRVVAPQPTATPSAFDLVTTPEGAALVYALPSRAGGGVRVAILDRMGSKRRDERSVFDPELPAGATGADAIAPEAIEVVAARSGDQLAVAWIEQARLAATVRAVLGTASGETFGPVRRLGTSMLATRAQRGRIAAAAADTGDVTVIFRGPVVPCEGAVARGESRGSCARVEVTRLGERRSSREGVPLVVPHPCDRVVAGVGYAEGAWHYGICASDGAQPVTTHYTVRFEPQYAHATPLLPGCTPESITDTRQGAALIARCAEGDRQIVVVREDGRVTEARGSPTDMLTCDDEEHLVLTTDGDPTLRVVLDTPMDRIEGLLPERVAPAGARAVFTGEALLIAVPLDREVSVHRWQCFRGEARRTDIG